MPAIHAAGGVLWRPTPTGPEVCLVHRPRYDDWSLPKGKLDRGEHPLAAALREVREETGFAGVPQLRLPTIGYPVPGAGDKRVDFWSMRAPETASGPPDREVDAVRWFALRDALGRLTYAGDADVLRDFAARRTVTAAVHLIRHARAGSRASFAGPDLERPLDPTGEQQARRLAGLLWRAGACRLVSAVPVRCRQTLLPLADRLELTVELEARFNEPTARPQTDECAATAATALIQLAATGRPAVVCSQGKLMPTMLARLAGEGSPDDYRTAKGTGWLIAFAGTSVVGLDRLIPDASAVAEPDGT